MRKSLILLLVACFSMTMSVAQTNTTQNFHEEHEDATSLFFYRNTIRMFAQLLKDDRIDDVVKEIEKMKFLRVEKTEDFLATEYKALVESYEDESYEDLMTMRSDGMNVNVLIREEGKVTKGLIIMANDEEQFMLLDVLGNVPLDSVAELLSYVQSAEGFDF